MEENSNGDEAKRATSWETYKLLNKIKGTVQQKRKVANDMCVLIVAGFSLHLYVISFIIFTI